MSNVASCGKKAIEEIKIKRPFSSYEEFVGKCRKGAVNKTIVENLDKVGAFASIHHVSEYEHEKYYLPILGLPVRQSFNDDFTEYVEDEDKRNEVMTYAWNRLNEI